PVLSHARSVLPRMQADFQNLLSDLDRQVEENARLTKEMQQATQELKRQTDQVRTEAERREQRRQREWDDKKETLIANFEARAQIMMEQVTETVEQRKASEQAQRLISR